jgi:dihydropteroate synthase
VRILAVEHEADLRRELGRVGVDPGAWDIFGEKKRVLAVTLEGLSVAAANILKQTALAVGADCAVDSRVIAGRVRHSDAVLFATPRQLVGICERLKHQPVCAARLVSMLAATIKRSRRPAPTIRVKGTALDLGARTYVMGVLNVTPDSFSDGGLFHDPGAAVAQALRMESEGADFIDVGAESTRPGARPVGPAEQERRLGPVLRGLARGLKVPVSVDTMSAAVAEFALDRGAAMVNDVSAFNTDPRMARVVARAGVPCLVMHMKGRPRTMQRNPQYHDLMGEVHDFLAAAVEAGVRAGVDREQMIVDPGIGFGKTDEQNFEILRRLAELRSLGLGILVGPSRKSFIGRTLGVGPGERLEGTIAASVLAAAHGANIVRVHDVHPVKRALAISDHVTGRC